MVQDMAAGKADLTWVGTRVFDMTRPDAVIVDIKMPPTHTEEGLVAAQRIRAEQPDVTQLFAELTLAENPDAHRRVLVVLAFLRSNPASLRAPGDSEPSNPSGLAVRTAAVDYG